MSLTRVSLAAATLALAWPVQPARAFCGFFVAGSNLDETYGPAYRGAREAGDATRWLANTKLLQHDHPKIRLLALKLTQLHGGAMQKSLACYRYVRNLPFACAANAATTPSVEVLAARVGDGGTKSTLLIALLRSLGIPARARVVTLKPDILRGFVDLDEGPVPHVFCEVLVEGEWLGVDSYMVDLPLGLKARGRLLSEKRASGYGVHLKGQLGWDGSSSSFGLFSSDDPASLPLLDLGAFDDVASFCRQAGHRLPSTWARKQQWALATSLANRRVRRLRDGPPQLLS